MLAAFEVFLKNKGISPRTQKNYLSDMKCFLKWLKKSELSAAKASAGKSGKPCLPAGPPAERAGRSGLTWFNQATIAAFKNSLILSQTPQTTINRRLSSLRQFGDFLISQGWLKENPAKNIKSLKSLKASTGLKGWRVTLRQFRQDLKAQGQKETTVKNYSADVRQYLEWAEEVKGKAFFESGEIKKHNIHQS